MIDLLSLGFLLLILVASGLIAWVADGLGKKIGKKRISVFGLRPKHVASLGTVLMGVCVSLVSIGLVAASSKEARVWLKKGSGLIKDLKLAEDDLKGTQSRNALLQRDIRKQERYARTLQERNETLGRENASLEEANGTLQVKLGKEQTSLAKVREALEDLKGERQRLVSERVELRGQVASYKTQVDSAKVQFATTNRNLEAARTRLASARTNLSTAKSNLVTAVANVKAAVVQQNSIGMKSLETSMQVRQLETEVAARQDLVDRLQKDTAQLVRERDDAETLVDDARERYQGVLAQLDEAGQRLALAQDLVTRFSGTTRTSRTEPLTYRRGEEVARIVVPAGSDEETAANLLASLLRTARSEASERGAKGHRANGQTFEAAEIVGRQDPKTGAVASPELLRRALVANVAGRKEDGVLVATSSLNAFNGEPVSLDIAVMSNPVVYRRNDTLAETRIDGAQPEGRILAQFTAFYNDKVREKAARDRMIPRAGTLRPFGGLSDADAWTLVQSVKRAGREVKVQAVAGSDIRAADPLSLEYRVR